MRKAIFTLVTILFFLTGYSQNNCDKKGMAEVLQYSGVYVFFNCQPLKEYTYIATMKKNIVSETAVESITKYAAAAKKLHPDCDAIIIKELHFGFSGDVIDIVKLK